MKEKKFRYEEATSPMRDLNKFADVLRQLVEMMPEKKHLKLGDYIGHLGLGYNPICSYGRVIIRREFFQKTYSYIYGQISEDEFLKIQKEYYRLDHEYWGERKFDTYHKRLLLPKLI